MEAKDKKSIKETAKKLFSLLGITADFKIKETDEGVELILQTTEEENGILIGYHGETLEALQLITALSVAKTIGKFIRISIEIGEYKKNRMQYLAQLVAQTKEKVLADGTGVALANLKSWERRFVHMLVQEDGQISSQSSGEGRDRVLTIYPKQ